VTCSVVTEAYLSEGAWKGAVGVGSAALVTATRSAVTETHLR